MEAVIGTLQTDFEGVTRNGKTLTFSGMNLQVVSGSGTTDGKINGLGNIIIGYNERRQDGTDNTTGSHNLIIGTMNDYQSYASAIVRSWNTASGKYSSAFGVGNMASGPGSSVSGGYNNTAGGESSSVSGGTSRQTTGQYNWAGGSYSSPN
jgi:hypothetical protein